MCEERHARTWEAPFVPGVVKSVETPHVSNKSIQVSLSRAKVGRLMAFGESDQPIVLRGRESRPHWLNPNGEGADSDTQFSKEPLTERERIGESMHPLTERNSE